MKGWRAVRVAAIALCAGMTFWLVRYEAFPGLFADEFSGYASFFRRGTLLSDRWAKILYEGEPIGYSHTLIDTQEGDTEAVYRVQNGTLLQMKLLGHVQSIKIEVEAALDRDYQLQTFQFRMAASNYRADVSGRRGEGDTFLVDVVTAAGTSRVNVEIPPDVVLYSPMTDMAMRRLKPGQKMVIRTLDPVTLARIDVLCEALGPEEIEFNGARRQAHALAMTYQGMTVRSWLDEEGEVLRQQTPLGWTMEASSFEEVMAMDLNAEITADLVLANAVPSDRPIAHPRQCRALVLRAHGLRLPLESLQSERQTVREEADGVRSFALRRLPFPATTAPLDAPLPEALLPHIQPTPYVQCDHPEMVAEAKRIIGSAATRGEAVRALTAWVDENVVDAPAASLPSALDVLHQRVGDCNEHTYLFVALARAVGIPAVIQVGLVYAEGEPGHGFYYHAWPSVHLGEGWHEVDPTLSQESADATHIMLLTGELQEQMKLLSVIGQVRVEVLDQQHGPDAEGALP